MSTVRKYLVLIICLLLAAFGISLQMRAAIGVSPFDALNQSISYSTNLRVGDVVTLLQLLFVIIQVVIVKKKTIWKFFLQMIVGFLLGQFINFFYYTIFGQLTVDNYLLKLLLLIGGTLWVPIFIGAIVALDLVTMPLESLSMVISKQVNYSFGQVRQSFDILFVIISIILTFVFSIPMTIREGTIFSALTFGPLLTFYMPKIRPYFEKWHLISVEENT